jgi:class 3 adenylate cyclase/tetratricopeptide (TPR) repeat protein
MDVAAWLRGLGLEQYAPAFRDNDVDGEVLPELTADDLINIGVTSVGHRRKLLAAIAVLREEPASLKNAPPLEGARREAGGLSEPTDIGSAERRQVTIMFCDVVGSTELATRLDPEDLREVIGAYHRCVAEVLGRFGGFVAKYMGDGILAYFGYPQAHEEDAEQAVRAGLEIVDAVGRLDLSQRLEVRLGIATGLVVVGDLIGAGAAQEQSVVGETPNLAARLQSLAVPNAIVIADTTRRQVGSLFEMRDLGPQSLKGFAGMPQAWQVLGQSGVANRFEALRSRGTPLVGRDEELDLLVRRWAQVKAGEGRVVLLSAEPGIGKSRLTEALQERFGAEPHRRLRYFCSPHHRESALYPIIGQLEHAAGFVRDDDAGTKHRKLAKVLAAASTAEDDLSLLAELLSLRGVKTQSSPDLTPQRKKEKIFDALLRGLADLSAQQPVLMVFEDVHWMDPTSLELLDLTIARIEHLPVLLIATFRPEFQPPWVGQAHVTMLSLSRLGPREGTALVRQLAGNAGLPADVIEEIIERTDGVPLFLEEVTKVVLEAGESGAALGAIPGARAAVPATLQASLMARLDRLGPVAREVAQTGAAIGREFPYELVAAAALRVEAETRGALDQLVAAGLVFQRGVPPAADYQFKHALVQDTAYGTLLRGPRQALHTRIAAAIETRMPDRVEREPETLAHHLAEAGRSERAASYWRKAGEQAVRRAANREAVGHFRRALALVAAQPETAERARAELAILSQLGPVLMAVYGWSAAEVGGVVERAAEIGRQLESSPDLAPAIANLWMFNIARGRLDRADEISADLFRMARALGDSEILLEAHHCAWATRFFQGRFKEAGEHIDAGASLYDGERHAHLRHIYLGHDPGICGMNFGASVQNALGYFERGQILAINGITQARLLEHPPSLANALWRACEAFVTSADVSSVLGNATELLGLADTHGLPLPRGWALAYLGWALARSGEPAEGMARFDEGQKMLTDMGAQVQATLLRGLRAEGLMAAGRYAEGLEQADQALEEATTRGELSYLSRLHRARAGLLLHSSAGNEAVQASLRQALLVAQQQAAKGWEIGAATDLAHYWSEHGRRAEASALLTHVYGWFTEGFDTASLKDAKLLLEELA